MGGGKDLLVARTEPPYEQGLRAVAGELEGLRLRGDEPSYGKEAGTYLRIIRQFLEGVFSEVRSGPVRWGPGTPEEGLGGWAPSRPQARGKPGRLSLEGGNKGRPSSTL